MSALSPSEVGSAELRASSGASPGRLGEISDAGRSDDAAKHQQRDGSRAATSAGDGPPSGAADSTGVEIPSAGRALRYRIEHRVYHAGMWPVHRFSHRNASRLGERFGQLYYHFAPGARRLSLENLRRVFPERDERELRRIARQAFACFGRVFLEEVSFRRFSRSELLERFDVVGRENLERARGLRRGLILMTGHYGAFDISVFPITQEIGSCHVLIRPPSNPLLRAEFEEVRKRLDTELVPRSRSGHRLYNILRRGGCIGLALDQRVRPWDGILVDFLGSPAWTSPVPAFLAWKSRAPVLPLFCTPQPGGRYLLEISEPVTIEDEEYDPAAITRQLSAELESKILEHPELWFWPHDRWCRTVRHRQPAALDRIRREADLEVLCGDEGDRPPPPARVGSLGSGRFLERADHLWLQGPRAACERWSLALARVLLGRGFAVRAIDTPRELARLAACPPGAQRQRHFQNLDSYALLFLAKLDQVRGSDQLELLGELLEHRRHRASVALLTPRDESAGCPDGGAGAVVRRWASRARPDVVECS